MVLRGSGIMVNDEVTVFVLLHGGLGLFLSGARAALRLDRVLQDRHAGSTMPLAVSVRRADALIVAAHLFLLGASTQLVVADFGAASNAHVFMVRAASVLLTEVPAAALLLVIAAHSWRALGRAFPLGCAVALGAILLRAATFIFAANQMDSPGGTDDDGVEDVVERLRLVAGAAATVGGALAAMSTRRKGWPRSVFQLVHPGSFGVACWVLQANAGLVEAVGFAVLTEQSLKACELAAEVLRATGALFLVLHSRSVADIAYALYRDPVSKGVSEAEEAASPRATSTNSVPAAAGGKFDFDVLVVGAGPTGLTLANVLGQQAVSTLVIELREEPIHDPRFFICNSVTCEGYKRLGLLEALKADAVPGEIPYGAQLTTGLAHPDAEMIASACAPGRDVLQPGQLTPVQESVALTSNYAEELPIRAMQSVQERVLKAGAEARSSVHVSYGEKLVTFVELPGGGVKANLEKVDGSSRTVNARYLVGADGPGSVVAKALSDNYRLPFYGVSRSHALDAPSGPCTLVRLRRAAVR